MPVFSIFSALRLTSSWQDNKLNALILSIAAGMILAAIITTVNKKTVGKLVKQILRQKINSAEQAKSLKELGIKQKGSIRYALRDGTILRKTVFCTADKNGEKRYYIPEEKISRAETIYGTKGASLLTLFIAIILIGVLAAVATSVVPDIIKLVKELG